MEIRRFIREHKPLWSELDELLSRFEKRRRTIEAAHIDRLTQLYKTVSAHLAYAQTYYPGDEITKLLNQTVARTHHILHAEQWKTSHPIGEFFKRHFPTYLLEHKYAILLALLLFTVGGLAGFLAVWTDPLHLYALVPAQMADQIDPHAVGSNHDQLMNATFSTTIMTNNIRVAILAFASGITFGLLTVYILIQNGLLIGALAAVFWQSGKSYVFWAYILPHGIIELLAIFIAGGAGLYMGYRMINPGNYTRKYRFLQSVKQSALLLVGTIPLFVIAGIIEGYITPSALSLEAKYAVAAATLVALVLYIGYGRMNERRARQRAAAV
ncbi:stage II sporulation protein M [Paenibacillaceae bacterium]|nr:stage II sporulation protein M [Paenibacillaceae bacterium]